MRSGVSLLLLLAPGLALAAIPALIALELPSLAVTLAELAAMILLARVQLWAVKKIHYWLGRK